MTPIADAQNIQYGLLDSADIQEMAGLLADVFSRFDPPAVAVGLSFEEVRGLVGLFGRRATDDGRQPWRSRFVRNTDGKH